MEIPTAQTALFFQCKEAILLPYILNGMIIGHQYLQERYEPTSIQDIKKRYFERQKQQLLHWP